MEPLPTSVYAVADVRRAERAGAALLGVALYALMERAGAAALADLQAVYPAARRLCVLCGPGNNGGDGYVLARLALAQGLGIEAWAPFGAPRPGTDAERAREAYLAAGGLVETGAADGARADRCTDRLADRLTDPSIDVIVDALYGSGLDRPLAGPAARLVAAISASPVPAYALDVPSGLDADRGGAGPAVRAARTLAFCALKPGYYLGHGPECTGMLAVAALGLPEAAFAGLAPVLRRLSAATVAAALPRRARLAHKGTSGHVLLVGGGAGMAGAARLAGWAALRAGAGLVTVATDPASAPIIAAAVPELIVVGVEDAAALRALAGRADLIAAGPGLGGSPWAGAIMAAVLECACPLVLDADALNWLARRPEVPVWRGPVCLTPHPGEAARLLGAASGYPDAGAVQADRLGAATALRSRYGATVVLKGAATLVAQEAGDIAVCDLGNPGMASAGLGDVLTGIIAAIAVQQPDRAGTGPGAIARAAAAGVRVHAEAGDLAAAGGERGLIASDVIDALRRPVNPALSP